MSLKKSIVFLTAVGAAVALVLFASSALAQDVAPATDMSWDEFGAQMGKVVSDWRTIGCIAGLVALINLLVLFMRFRPLNEWLERKGWKWIKVYAAAGLGALLTFITSYQTGSPGHSGAGNRQQ